MTKQKFVISVPMEDAKKKSKALTVVVNFHGVISVEVDNGKLSVVGEGVDSIALTRCLRKKMCHAQIVSVAAVEEKKEEKKEEKPPVIWNWPNPYPHQLYCYDAPRDTCTIL